MIKPVWVYVLFLTLLFAIPLTLAEDDPTTWYVDASVSVSGDGRLPDTAFKTIQEAIYVHSAGDTILIAEGHYAPDYPLTLYQDTSLIGAGADVTTIGAENLPLGITLRLSSGTTVEGFTINVKEAPEYSSSIGIDLFYWHIDSPETYIRHNRFMGDGLASSALTAFCNGLQCDLYHLVVENNIFDGFTSSAVSGIELGRDVGITLTIRNNTFLNSKSGVTLENPNSIIENNIFTNMVYAGIVPHSWVHDRNIQYNLFWNNHMDTISEADWPTDHLLESWAVLGEGNVFADPLLNSDYQPTVGSPATDAGNPEQTDTDGTRRDIGAFNGLLPLDFVGISFDLPTAVPLRTSVPTSVPPETLVSTISGTVTLHAHAPTLSTTLTVTHGLTNTQVFTMTGLDRDQQVAFPITIHSDTSGWLDIEATVTWPTGQNSASHRVLVSTHETYLSTIIKEGD